MDVLDAGASQNKVKDIVEAQAQLHKKVCDKIQHNRDIQRQSMSRGHLPNIAVGNYLLIARSQLPGSTPTLGSTWTGPCRVVGADKMHVYSFGNIASDKVKDVRAFVFISMTRWKSRRT